MHKIIDLRDDHSTGVMEIRSLVDGCVKRDILIRKDDIRAIILWGPEEGDDYTVSLCQYLDTDIDFHLTEADARDFYNKLRSAMRDVPQGHPKHYTKRDEKEDQK